jgi:hypothetical protein
VLWKKSHSKNPKRGAFDLDFLKADFDEFFRGTRLGSLLVPLKNSE